MLEIVLTGLYRFTLNKKFPFIEMIFVSVLFILFIFLVDKNSSNHELRFVEDDYFYYAEIARNFVTKGHLSFGGLVDTNGFHPLWMILLIGLTIIFPTQSSGFFLTLMVLIAALSIVGSYGFERTIRRWKPDQASSRIGAVLYFILAFRLGTTGMEAILCLALLPIFVLYLDISYESGRAINFFASGLLAGLVVLSRLDSFIMIIALSLAMAAGYRRLPARVPMAMFLAGGSIALAPYLIFNFIHFGAFVPISGAAKSMLVANAPLFSKASLLSNINADSLLSLIIPSGLWIVLIISLSLFSLTMKKIKTKKDRIFCCISAFSAAATIIYALTTAARSDWPLWPWYHYNLVFSSICCSQFCLSNLWTPKDKVISYVNFAALFLFSIYLSVWAVTRTVEKTPILASAELIEQKFSPIAGTYAMGDRSGAVGYLLRHPFIQLEGLVEDKDFLDQVRKSRNLLEVLLERHATYYITVAAISNKDGCWRVREPSMAGPAAPAMTDEFCAAPIFESNVSGQRTLVFSVSQMAMGRKEPAAGSGG